MSVENLSDLAFFSTVIFIGLIMVLVLTVLANAMGGVVGIIILYIMFGISAGVGYYITAYTDL